MITVKAVSGPSAAYVYLEGTHSECPQATRRRSISCAALADGSVTIANEKSLLTAEVEQSKLNWDAAQAALQEL